MPIKDVSEIRRMPRLGKIRLGIKVEPTEEGKNPYPRATDYFVVPESIKQYLEPKPKKLDIMFPTEKVEEFAQQWLRCYSFTQGLVCKGDGHLSTRKVDIETGDLARHTTVEWVFREFSCDPETCVEYVGDPERDIKPQCRRVMNLMFLMPEIPGFGVWQLDTTSFNSIVNINSCIDLIRRICGRISFIPLILSLDPIEVSPPGIKKKTVHVLSIKSDAKLVDIQKLGAVAPEQVLLPAVAEEEAPEDLFPPATLEKTEKAEKPPPEPVAQKTPDDVTEDDVPDLNAFFRLIWHFWEMQPADGYGELGYKSKTEAYEAYAGKSGWEAWLTIKGLKHPKE